MGSYQVSRLAKRAGLVNFIVPVFAPARIDIEALFQSSHFPLEVPILDVGNYSESS